MSTDQTITTAVRSRYARIAVEPSSCCPPGAEADLGYTPEDLAAIPDEAALGLGCGNPTAFSEIKRGDVVLDLGSGAGIDAFIAAKRVGDSGRVIGVDMTPEMIDRARAAAARIGESRVEFRLGQIEELPVDDASVDLVISNCVINLIPDKTRAFAEAHRVLRPGGRMVVSDIVGSPTIRDDLDSWAQCEAGAVPEDEYLGAIRSAGFDSIRILDRTSTHAGNLSSVTVIAVRSS